MPKLIYISDMPDADREVDVEADQPTTSSAEPNASSEEGEINVLFIILSNVVHENNAQKWQSNFMVIILYSIL